LPRVSLALALSGVLLACTDVPGAPPLAPTAPAFASEGRGDFHRYVAIGTSVSMGYRSDGVLAGSQLTSWPAQLAQLAGREMTLPLIASPGCGAPIIAPLALGRRLSGEAIIDPFSERICAPNEPGVTLPAQNLAINGARTLHALTATPEAPDPNNDRLYARVLPPGMTQVSAMMALNPKIVSVEFGGNEVLGARLGYAIRAPGGNMVRVVDWESPYREVVAAVARTAKRAVLVGLVDDITSFPSMRRARELWDARQTFVPLYVTVSPTCNNEDLVFVPAIVLNAALRGARNRALGQPPYDLTCQNFPDDAPIPDAVLSPATVAGVNTQLGRMNDVIRAEAERYGFAYFALGALYEEAVVKPPFDAYAMLTSATPFGPLISLDGVHPSAEGSTVLARAAAEALNETYHMGIPLPPMPATSTLLAVH
jgi:hypothetical protein